MSVSRREFGKIALATVPVTALFEKSLLGSALRQATPNSRFGGVQIGTITYSYRSMPDSSAEATLKYIVDSGISACELMGGPVDDWMRKKGKYPEDLAAARGGGRGRSAAAAPAGAVAGAPSSRVGGGTPAPPVAGMMTGPNNNQPSGQWNGVSCPAPNAGGAVAGQDVVATPGGAPATATAGRGGGRGGGQTPEQLAAAEKERKWRLGLSMDIFKELKKMYNDAGVTIYAVKNVQANASDEDLDFQLTVAKTLGATHVTLELPSGADAEKTLRRMGDFALKHNLYAAYHTHTQGGMAVFDTAFAVSKGNKGNVDFGHFVAGGNKGGTPLDFLQKFHDRIASFHLKDRTTPAHCALNLPWGAGETPIKEILQMLKTNKWDIPASIELEYNVPAGSDAVKEVRKCLEYCRQALA